MDEPLNRPNQPHFHQSTGRVENLKDQLTKILKHEDLSRKLKFIQVFAQQSGTDIEHVAAALLVLTETYRSTPYDRRPRKESGQQRFQDQTRNQNGRGGFDSQTRFQRKERRPNRTSSGPMAKYRIEVGRAHGVGPGQIVGVITNESGLSGADIGGIDIQTNFSTVDLPQSMSDDMLRELRQLRVAGQALRLSRWERGGDGRLTEKPRRFNKKKGGKPSWKKSRKRQAPTTSN